jgi:3-dehydroquinate synthase
VAEPIRLEIRAGASTYPAFVGHRLAESMPALLAELGLRGRLRLIADERVLPTHGARLVAALEQAGRSVATLAISGQEQHKNLAVVSRVYDWLVEVGTDRSDLILALGGGVVGDLVGFAAATFLRGLRLIQLPTTVLAMVDSSIGGKTGVDHSAGKNLIGAFYQPALVVADLGFLATLPRREIVNGWAEVIKMGVICAPDLFDRLEREPEDALELGPLAEWAIARAIQLKGEVVAADERETDLRMILNYGHTIGHAIEAATGFSRYLHGEAVAVGMVGAARLAVTRGLLDESSEQRQRSLLERFGLPTSCLGLDRQALWAPLRHDKKAVGSRLRWVLPTKIGSVDVHSDIDEGQVDEILTWLAREAG